MKYFRHIYSNLIYRQDLLNGTHKYFCDGSWFTPYSISGYEEHLDEISKDEAFLELI
ncbi:MAG: hypothetical protein KAS32_22625 [Candidatus Peribacteraceae bacterium]|nr:hypothetical protein [Candidatus Peribacteraceae bacterium]